MELNRQNFEPKVSETWRDFVYHWEGVCSSTSGNCELHPLEKSCNNHNDKTSNVFFLFSLTADTQEPRRRVTFRYTGGYTTDYTARWPESQSCSFERSYLRGTWVPPRSARKKITGSVTLVKWKRSRVSVTNFHTLQLHTAFCSWAGS